jgi:hypothetical protein
MRSDHFSLQVRVEMPFPVFNARLTKFLGQSAVIRTDKKGFYERHPDMSPEAMGFSENA